MRHDDSVNIRGRRRAAPVIFVLSVLTIAAAALVAAPAHAGATPVAHGTVTAADGSGPIAGITVCATHRNTSGDYGGRRCTETAADGTYRIQVAAGLYSFHAEEPYLYGTWLPQHYNARKAYVFGATTSRTFNFQLVRGASISGYLTPPEGGPRIDYTHVTAYRLDSTGKPGARVSFSNVTSSGYYSISKLPAGSYKLQVDDGFGPAGYMNQWYPAAAAASGGEAVTVGAGEHVTGRGISLTLSGSLTINLRKVDGSPVKGQVQVFDQDGREIWQWADGDPSTRTITGLHPGTYRVRATLPTIGYREWYSYKRTLATANPITVTSGATTNRTLTFHYRTLKATTRPKLKVGDADVIATKGLWSPVTPTHYRYDWIRDGKMFLRTSANWHVLSRADVGHRIKVCVRASRTGYAAGRSCTDYSRTIRTY